jgi:hypothetical protein
MRSISIEELARRLHAVCDGIERNGEVWEVRADLRGQSFILGPPSICGRVLGLYGEEYGWPEEVRIDEGCKPSALLPGRRRHPFLTRQGRCVAVAVSRREYEDILASLELSCGDASQATC